MVTVDDGSNKREGAHDKVGITRRAHGNASGIHMVGNYQTHTQGIRQPMQLCHTLAQLLHEIISTAEKQRV